MQRLTLSSIKHLKLSGVTIDDDSNTLVPEIIQWPLRTLYLDLNSLSNQSGHRYKSLAVARIIRLCSMTLETLVLKCFRGTRDEYRSTAWYVTLVLCSMSLDVLVLCNTRLFWVSVTESLTPMSTIALWDVLPPFPRLRHLSIGCDVDVPWVLWKLCKKQAPNSRARYASVSRVKILPHCSPPF